MSIRFAEDFTFRSLDFAFPHAACDAVFAVERDYIRKGVVTRSSCSGPMPTGDGRRVSGTMSRRVMMVDERWADAFIADLEAACAPFPVDDKDWHGFGDNVVEV